MSKPTVRHQTFDYSLYPFYLTEVPADFRDAYMLNPHWHEDLEIYYTLQGFSQHIINGTCYKENPGRVIVTNSEFIHNIIPDPELEGVHGIAGFLIIINADFIKENFPQYQDIYFTNDNLVASQQTVDTIRNIWSFSQKEETGPYDDLYIKGQVLVLLYDLCQEGTVRREEVDKINSLKNIERIKGVLQYVQDYYQDPLTQNEVAEKFHFSAPYFARYFKKCTGMTFMEYLTEFRVNEARIRLAHGDEPVYQIAMETGFSDDRRLIIAFKKKYGVTPLQYRKSLEQ